ncbi:hypothetical protein BC936DRAFT_147805, partial [Jimgerdemannia flammicorona]
MSSNKQTKQEVNDADEARLNQLGYRQVRHGATTNHIHLITFAKKKKKKKKNRLPIFFFFGCFAIDFTLQELKRELTTFTNYGIALSLVCICSGLTSLFAYGLTTGGPVVMTWGWLIVSFFTIMVGLAMAGRRCRLIVLCHTMSWRFVDNTCSIYSEICSAYPTSGGLYFWSARLTPPHLKPFASWMTGWFNLIGQFAVTAGIDFGLALMLGATISVGTDFAFKPTPPTIIGMHIAICLSHGIANSLGPKVMKFITWIS